MADASQLEFDKRMRRISKTHARLARGYVTSVNHDGLIIARPVRQGLRFPFRGLFMSFLVLLAFKAFILASLGTGAYSARLDRLESGTTVEQLGAYIMKPDPVTQWIAFQMKAYMPSVF